MISPCFQCGLVQNGCRYCCKSTNYWVPRKVLHKCSYLFIQSLLLNLWILTKNKPRTLMALPGTLHFCPRLKKVPMCLPLVQSSILLKHWVILLQFSRAILESLDITNFPRKEHKMLLLICWHLKPPEYP